MNGTVSVTLESVTTDTGEREISDILITDGNGDALLNTGIRTLYAEPPVNTDCPRFYEIAPMVMKHLRENPVICSDRNLLESQLKTTAYAAECSEIYWQ